MRRQQQHRPLAWSLQCSWKSGARCPECCLGASIYLHDSTRLAADRSHAFAELSVELSSRLPQSVKPAVQATEIATVLQALESRKLRVNLLPTTTFVQLYSRKNTLIMPSDRPTYLAMIEVELVPCCLCDVFRWFLLDYVPTLLRSMRLLVFDAICRCLIA